MDNEVLISVIVPVYNSEKFISCCVESILNQSFRQFELILVLDGCVDESPLTCKRYASQDDRIKIYEQSNQGVSAARNNGIQKAIGKYIAFVDSDDWIDIDFLEKLFLQAEKTQCDIVLCGYYAETNRKSERNRFFKFHSHLFDENEKFSLCANCLFCDYQGRRNAPTNVGVPWARLYRSTLIKQNNLRFVEGLSFCEDSIFNFQAFLKSDLTILIEDCLYHYRIRSNSISHLYKPKMNEISEAVCNEVLKCTQTLGNECWNVMCFDKWTVCLFDILRFQLVPTECPLSIKEKIKYFRYITESEDAPYKRVWQDRKSLLTGSTRIFWHLLRLRQYWFIYLYCDLKFRVLGFKV